MYFTPRIVLFLTALAAALVLGLRSLRFLKKTMAIRRSWRSLPGAPRSFIAGNLNNLAQFLASDKHPGKLPNVSRVVNVMRNSQSFSPLLSRLATDLIRADYGLYAIWKSLGKPKWFLVDLWPLQVPLICIADPIIAEQLTRATAAQPESTPKMKTPESLRTLLGSTSISTAQVSPAVKAKFNLEILLLIRLTRS